MAHYLAGERYKVLKAVVSSQEINAVKDHIARYLTAKMTTSFVGQSNVFVSDQYWSSKIYDQLDPDLQHLYRGEAPLEIRTSDGVIALGTSPKLVAQIKRLLGTSKIGMHTPPSVRVVRPNSTLCAVPPHIDQLYNQHMPEFLTAWVPLADITPSAPGMAIKTKSDERYADTANFVLREHWFDPVFADLDSYEPIEMRVGDVLIFDKDVVHKSLTNTSEFLRLSIDFRYFPLESGSSKKYRNLENV